MYLRSFCFADLAFPSTSEFELMDMAGKQDTCRHCMYILLFACACGKRAGVTAPHYILHMFCLFCTCVGCAHYMLQDCGSLLCTSTLKRIVSVDANGKHVTVIEEYKQQLVHLYLHQNDARTLHLSFVVSIARW